MEAQPVRLGLLAPTMPRARKPTSGKGLSCRDRPSEIFHFVPESDLTERLVTVAPAFRQTSRRHNLMRKTPLV